MLAAAAFGALWALIPAYLQAKRGSHIVITTIMFNMLASALLVYLLVNVMGEAGLHGRETRDLRADGRTCRSCMRSLAALRHRRSPPSPLNLSFLLALAWPRRACGS